MVQSQCLGPAFSCANMPAAGIIASNLGSLDWAPSLLTPAETEAVFTKDYTVGLPSDQATGHPGYKNTQFCLLFEQIKAIGKAGLKVGSAGDVWRGRDLACLKMNIEHT